MKTVLDFDPPLDTEMHPGAWLGRLVPRREGRSVEGEQLGREQWFLMLSLLEA